MHPVLVLPSPFTKGAASLSSECSVFEPVPLKEALESEYAEDAHFCGYYVSHPSGFPAYPRLTKRSAVVRELREAGYEVLVSVIGIDVDNPGHKSWSELGQDAETEVLRQLGVISRSGIDWARSWRCAYSTRGGWRLVYALSEPVEVESFSGMALGMVEALNAAGIKADPSCSDWTRLFRLPRVVRRHGEVTEPTWTQSYFCAFDQEEVLVGGMVVPSANAKAGSNAQEDCEAVEVPNEPLPDIDAALQLLVDDVGAPSPWAREARRRLKGRRCFPCIFEHAPLAQEGSRDSTLTSFVGEAISSLLQVPGTTMTHVWALFVGPAQQLAADPHGPPWEFVAWQKILRIWAIEAGKLEFRKRRGELRKGSYVDQFALLLDGMRSWCVLDDAPELHAQDDLARIWASARLIAVTPTEDCYVMRPDGYYDSMAVKPSLLPVRIRELGMETLIPLFRSVSDEKQAPIPPRMLVEKHGTLVRTIVGVGGGRGSTVVAYGTENATIKVRLYARKSEEDLPPEFDRDVDEWLRRLAGDGYENLCEWLGHALAFEDGPICALSIAGVAGCGKKMIARGLAECIDTEKIADASPFGTYQGALLKTPFVVLNEGLSIAPGSNASSFADTFRHYTGGDPIQVNEKYQPLVEVRGALRVLITTNNLDVVNLLAGGRDLSPDDREALALRLLHIDATGSTAPSWFRSKGGLAWTSAPGRRWVAPDSGGRSDYVVARHFMHLWKTRKPPRRGARLLVEGGLEQEVMHDLVVRGGMSPIVVECLCRMVDSSTRSAGVSVDAKAGRFWVTTSGIVDYFRDFLSAKVGQQARITTRAVSLILKGLQPKGSDRMRTARKTSADTTVEARWHEIDLDLLFREAQANGYPQTRIRQLLESRDRQRFGESSLLPVPKVAPEAPTKPKFGNIFRRPL